MLPFTLPPPPCCRKRRISRETEDNPGAALYRRELKRVSFSFPHILTLL
jgi:hypothetical protein